MSQAAPQLGRPVRDPRDDFLENTDWTCSPPVHIPPAEPARPRTGRLAIGAIAAVLVGVAIGWAASSIAQPDPLDVASYPHHMPAEVAALAEQFVHLYLSGDDAGRYSADDAPNPAGAWITSTAAIGAKSRMDGSWEVTVAVTTVNPVDGNLGLAPLAYFAVPIATSGDRVMAAAPPARVPAPPPPVLNSESLGPASAEQAEAATAFIGLYLTGDAAAARYLATPTDIAFFDSAPYAAVTTEVRGADQLGRVVVAANATTVHGVTHDLEYSVTLVRRGAVWEVLGIGAGA